MRAENSPELPPIETATSSEDQGSLSTSGTLARLRADRLTADRAAMVASALEAFDLESYAILTEI